MNYVLHIGRNKTGTTTLQKFLQRNREALRALGYYYPATAPAPNAHHYLARFCNTRWIASASPAMQQRARDAAAAFDAEVRDCSETVIVSSEGFLHCQPELVAKLFPPGKTRVVVYLREPLGYLVSAYQQSVHATRMTVTLDEAARSYLVDYEAFLAPWEQVYGTESLTVRPYVRAALLNEDIVADFLACIGLPFDTSLARLPTDGNPSIGGALLELKRALNHCTLDPRTERHIYRVFSTFADEDPALRQPPILNEQLALRLAGQLRASIQRVSNRHFGGSDLILPRPRLGQSADQAVSVADLAKLLNRIRIALPGMHARFAPALEEWAGLPAPALPAAPTPADHFRCALDLAVAALARLAGQQLPLQLNRFAAA